MNTHKQPSSHLTELLADMVTDYQHHDEAAAEDGTPPAAETAVKTTLTSAPVTVTVTRQPAAEPLAGTTETGASVEVPAAASAPRAQTVVAAVAKTAPVAVPDMPPPADLTPPATPVVDEAPITVPDVPADALITPPPPPQEHAEAAFPTEPLMSTPSAPEGLGRPAEAEKLMSAAILGEGLAAPAEPHPLIEKMAVEAVRLNASDIFISTGFPPSFKIDSILTPAPVKPLERDEAAKIVFSTMNKAQRAQFAQDLELNYSLQAKNGVRFRVNSYHEQGRIGMVMRRITTEISTVDDLFLPQALKDLAMMPRGLIILAGATGSGKSTSMAAMLDWRNEHAAGHIVTIEDPIEYIHRPKKSIITHREVGIDTLSWSNAVQSAMRQAPDVVCVGEVRNALSLEYAMQLAQTGHLCFFTIHASNASQAVERILNLFPEERHQQVLMDLALNLVCIIGQRLVIKKGGKGRRAIVDLLINTPAMQDYVFKGQYLEMRQLMEKAEQDGMQTFDQDLFNLYCDEIIDYEEALRQAESVNDLRLRIKLYEEGRATEHIFDRVEDLNLM